jgi:hypothetical protein
LLLCSGCAGYKLGPTNGVEAGAHSVQVVPFVNKTMEPRLGASVTSSLRKSVQQDGTYRLETDDSADIIVTGTVIEYERSHISFQPNDIITPRDYRLVMRAQVKATERATGKVLMNREVVGRTTVRVGSDLTSAERQAIPLMADDLARRATAFLVDGTW